MWGAPIYGWVYPEGSCDDGTDNGYACASLTPEQCACLMYGLGCEGGGTGGDILEEYDSVLLDINNPCIDSLFKRMNRIQGGSMSSLLHWVNQTFGQSSILYLRIMDGINFSDPDKYADWGPNPSYAGAYFLRLNDLKLQNASQEFRTFVILHELYHGYLAINGLDVLSTNDHNLFVSYRHRLADQLRLIFPSLNQDDALNLTWAGLSKTAAWNGSLTQVERDSINSRISDYINGNKGNYGCY